jgi:hypothetical protein
MAAPANIEAYDFKNYIPNILQTLIDRIPTGAAPTAITKAGLGMVLDEVKKLDDVVKNPDEMKSALANQLAVESQRFALHQTFIFVKQKIDEVINKFKFTALNQRLMQSDLKVDAFASETRQVFRTLTMGDKYTFLNQAIKDGQGSIVAAVTLDVPALLVGLTVDQQLNFKNVYLDKWSSYNTDYIDELESVVSTFFSQIEGLRLDKLPEEVTKHLPKLAAELMAGKRTLAGV